MNKTFEMLDAKLNAFVSLAPPAMLKAANAHTGALSGLSVGVKDIIDVAGLPTKNGSLAFADAKTEGTDAAVVKALRVAGATMVGKTTTTEFAFTDPTDCRNPYDLRRSPGGSSSGSGAAVSAGLVDLALGTQTAGSLCRPAAYCGVVGFKPSYGLLPTDGVTPLAPSFDTLGVMARTVAPLLKTLDVLADPTVSSGSKVNQFARLLLPTDVTATPEYLAAFDDASRTLAATNGPVREITLDLDIGAIVVAHRCIMLAEAAHAHGYLLANPTADKLQPNFRTALERGAALNAADVTKALDTLALAKVSFWRQLENVDVVLTLAVPDGAPLLDGTTGFQDWLTPWTVFGGPLVTLPWGLDSIGRPRSVMLAGRPSSDMQLLKIAQKLEEQAPTLPRPDNAMV